MTAEPEPRRQGLRGRRELSVEGGSIEEGGQQSPRWRVRQARRKHRSPRMRMEPCCLTIEWKPAYCEGQEAIMVLTDGETEEKAEQRLRLGQPNYVESQVTRRYT